MAPPEVARVSLIRPHLLARSQSPRECSENNVNNEDEDSWEVRAFAEDTANGMGTIWPPRSYTCSFCRREFRSAQALGGHMNVHRRDRARLYQTQNNLMKVSNLNIPSSKLNSSSSTSLNSTRLISTQEFLVNGEICLLHQLPDNNNPDPLDPEILLSISPYPVSYSKPDFIKSYGHATFTSATLSTDCHKSPVTMGDEVDLELRLGQVGPTATS